MKEPKVHLRLAIDAKYEPYLEWCSCGHRKIIHKMREPHACMDTDCACTAFVKIDGTENGTT